MATLERIRYTPQTIVVEDGKVSYSESSRRVIAGLPQLFWADCSPWREANLWALERASSNEASLKTVAGNLNGLLHYANFLEEQSLLWLAFPVRKANRCLVQYRGSLVAARDAGLMSPSTVSEYMRNAVSFYRWARAKGLLDPNTQLWQDRAVYIQYFDAVGFERTMVQVSTDLAIPNRKRPGAPLEDGLLPVSAEDRELILDFAKNNASPELYRMLALGFFTGMRIGSICDLKIQTLKNAIPDPQAPGLLRLALGPGASPPVNTKFGVTGHVWIPRALLEDLLEYATSLRRSKRQAEALPDDRGLLLLTRFGNPYCRRDTEQSSAINTEMATLRRSGVTAGLKVLKSFHFHQTRCTFATEVAELALKTTDPINAIALVKNALLHKDEATSFKYIKFIASTPAKRAAADEFAKAFAGMGR
ncbi:site-specific integrase [Dechloromonas sp. CZR5]|uniref:site-specific integrase n=1 Tax=Dechloromonas sp. CZR5 TaxID=2608630 RepID=UPI00123DDF74|nr:site-specific integrase [Dechloromonas sp. CZR5]